MNTRISVAMLIATVFAGCTGTVFREEHGPGALGRQAETGATSTATTATTASSSSTASSSASTGGAGGSDGAGGGPASSSSSSETSTGSGGAGGATASSSSSTSGTPDAGPEADDAGSAPEVDAAGVDASSSATSGGPEAPPPCPAGQTCPYGTCNDSTILDPPGCPPGGQYNHTVCVSNVCRAAWFVSSPSECPSPPAVLCWTQTCVGADHCPY